MREKTYKIALGGILSALAVIFLLMGGIFPFAEFVGPSLACLCVMIFLVESGRKWAVFMYLAVSLLSLLLSPNLESTLLFVFFLGWYPLLKLRLDCVKPVLLSWILKLAAMDVCVGVMYWVLLKLLTVPALTEEFAAYSAVMLAALILMANVAFLLIDVCLSRVAIAYVTRYRDRFIRK